MKKGFTLVELLAVIVILAIILAIAIPGISNIIDSSKKGAAENDVKMIIKAIDLKKIAEDTFDPTTVTEETIEEKLGISASNYERITVKEMNGQLYVTMVGKNKWEGITVSGTKTNTRTDETITTPEEKPNTPELAAGMIPIKWVTDHWVTTTEDDPEWYEYGTTQATRRWANAITRDCEIVDGVPTNIETCSMWVWIPRYVYKINSGWHTDTIGTIDIQFSKGVDDNWNKTDPEVGPIDLRERADASNALTNGDRYTNHPAFTFGDIELTGIWVAKFEASSSGLLSTASACNEADNTANKAVKSIPGVQSWRCQTIGNAFTASRNMEMSDGYGWDVASTLQENGTFITDGNAVDTHLMKNSEWGAVAYLTTSIYGKNNEITINADSNYYTGGGSGNSYITNEEQSTTDNIYGIYDISGGTSERTSAYFTTGHINLTTYGLSIVNANIKYKNTYQGYATNIDDRESARALKGDAVYDVGIGAWSDGLAYQESPIGWHGDYTLYPYSNSPWFLRGGRHNNSSYAGSFSFVNTYGGSYIYAGFRPVLAVKAGL